MDQPICSFNNMPENIQSEFWEKPKDYCKTNLWTFCQNSENLELFETTYNSVNVGTEMYM